MLYWRHRISCLLPILDLADLEVKQRHDNLLARFLPPNTAKGQAVKLCGERARRVIESGDDGSSALLLFQGQGATHENEATDGHGPICEPGNYASIGCIQTLSFSRGMSHISSSDPGAKPDIDPGYFSHPLDLELMACHLLTCLKVQAAEPISSNFKPDGKRNREKVFIETHEDAKQYLIDTAKTTYHCCGTCSTRPKDQSELWIVI